ncbi:MAG: alanine racemase [Planctomycetes bacterium]|nr:alanine racemase [Planctomycetota bacterium]
MSPTVDPGLASALAALGHATGPLAIGGVPAAELAATFGTPTYVFDAVVLRRQAARVQQALGPRVRLLWSVKANPSVAVTRELRRAGTGAEIASLGELHVALAAGHVAATLRFAGPGKTDAELDAALAAGLGCFHVESADEAATLARLAAVRGVVACVALRVNFPQELSGARMRMGGGSSRFGIDEAELDAVARAVLAQPSLRLVGLHAYAGTQVFDAAAFGRHCERVGRCLAALEQALGIVLPEIDVGGGFGVPVYGGDPLFELDAAAAALHTVVRAHDRPERTWFVELGRFLAAPAGVYLARVVRTKRSGGHAHAVLDGGMHHAAAAAGMGAVLRRPALMVAVAEPLRHGTPVMVGGPLCTPADQFGDGIGIGPLAAGDLVAVLHAGAYGLTFSPHSFLGHPAPAEVLVEGGVARIVRDRGQATDALRGQHP